MQQKKEKLGTFYLIFAILFLQVYLYFYKFFLENIYDKTKYLKYEIFKI